MLTNLPGVRNVSAAQTGTDLQVEDVVCEDCLAAKSNLHCIDASIQVDLSDGEDDGNVMGKKEEKRIPVYSREDIREQYCINEKEVAVLDNRSRKGLLGCFSEQQQGSSLCSKHGKKSFFPSCIGRSGSDEEVSDLYQNADRRPVSPQGKGRTWTGHYRSEEDEGFDEGYFRRRPKSFCAENRRFGAGMDPGVRLSQISGLDEIYIRNKSLGYTGIPPMMMRPPMMSWGYPCPQYPPSYPYMQTNTPDLLLHRRQMDESEVSLDDKKPKHVSFESNLMRSQTVGYMTEHENRNGSAIDRTSPPMSATPTSLSATPSKSSERLIDGRKTPDYALYSELFTPELARQIVLDRLKKTSMRTQATQTDVRRHHEQQLAQLQQLKQLRRMSASQKKMHSEGVQTGSGLRSPLQEAEGIPVQTSQAPFSQYKVQVYNLDSPPGGKSSRKSRRGGGGTRGESVRQDRARCLSSDNMISNDSGYSSCGSRPQKNQSKLVKSLSSDGILQGNLPGEEEEDVEHRFDGDYVPLGLRGSEADYPPTAGSSRRNTEKLSDMSSSRNTPESGRQERRGSARGIPVSPPSISSAASNRVQTLPRSTGSPRTRAKPHKYEYSPPMSSSTRAHTVQSTTTRQNNGSTHAAAAAGRRASEKGTRSCRKQHDGRITANKSGSIQNISPLYPPPTSTRSSHHPLGSLSTDDEPDLGAKLSPLGSNSSLAESPAFNPSNASVEVTRSTACTAADQPQIEQSQSVSKPLTTSEYTVQSDPSRHGESSSLASENVHQERISLSHKLSQLSGRTAVLTVEETLCRSAAVLENISEQQKSASLKPSCAHRDKGRLRTEDSVSLEQLTQIENLQDKPGDEDSLKQRLSGDNEEEPAKTQPTSASLRSLETPTSPAAEADIVSGADTTTETVGTKTSTENNEQPAEITAEAVHGIDTASEKEVLPRVVSEEPQRFEDELCEVSVQEQEDDSTAYSRSPGVKSPLSDVSSSSAGSYSVTTESVGNKLSSESSYHLSKVSKCSADLVVGFNIVQQKEATGKMISPTEEEHEDNLNEFGTDKIVLKEIEEDQPKQVRAELPKQESSAMDRVIGVDVLDEKPAVERVQTQEITITDREPSEEISNQNRGIAQDVTTTLERDSTKDTAILDRDPSPERLENSNSQVESVSEMNADTTNRTSSNGGCQTENSSDQLIRKETDSRLSDSGVGPKTGSGGSSREDLRSGQTCCRERARSTETLSEDVVEEILEDPEEEEDTDRTEDDLGAREKVVVKGTDQSKRREDMKLNLTKLDGQQSAEVVRRRMVETDIKRSSFDEVPNRPRKSSVRTPLSISRGIEEVVASPSSLARSPAMHEGFRLRDWKVERTPINTPDTDNRIPSIQDVESDESEDEMFEGINRPIIFNQVRLEDSISNHSDTDLPSSLSEYVVSETDKPRHSVGSSNQERSSISEYSRHIEGDQFRGSRDTVFSGTQHDEGNYQKSVLHLDHLHDISASEDVCPGQQADLEVNLPPRFIHESQSVQSSSDVEDSRSAQLPDLEVVHGGQAVTASEMKDMPGRNSVRPPVARPVISPEQIRFLNQLVNTDTESEGVADDVHDHAEVAEGHLEVKEVKEHLSVMLGKGSEDNSLLITSLDLEDVPTLEQEAKLPDPDLQQQTDETRAGHLERVPSIVKPPEGFGDSPEKHTPPAPFLEAATSNPEPPLDNEILQTTSVQTDMTTKLLISSNSKAQMSSRILSEDSLVSTKEEDSGFSHPELRESSSLHSSTLQYNRRRSVAREDPRRKSVIGIEESQNRLANPTRHSSTASTVSMDRTSTASSEVNLVERKQVDSSTLDNRNREHSTVSSSGSRARNKTNNKLRSRSRSSERILQAVRDKEEEPLGIHLGEYENQAWVYVGQHLNISTEKERCLQRSESIESTMSEKEFSKRYQQITHRMVHRKSSSIMYTRILERTFDCNKTVTVQRVKGEFGFRIHGSRPVVVSAIESGTPAASSGLCVGDILLTLNGVNVLDLPHTEVVKVAQKCSGSLELGLVSTLEEGEEKSRNVFAQLQLNQQVICSGFLYKKKRSLVPSQQWTKRWFILRADNCLYSFKSQQESRPSGALLLPGCTVGQLVPADQLYTIKIVRPDGGSVEIGAETTEQGADWHSVLSSSSTARRSETDLWIEIAKTRANMKFKEHTCPDCRGSLHSLVAGQWQERSLVLTDGCLYVYKHQDEPASSVLFLHGYKAQPGNFGGRKQAFQLIPTHQDLRHYFFYAETDTEKKRWLAALEFSIERWMRLS